MVPLTQSSFEHIAIERYTIPQLKHAYTVLSERYRSQKRKGGLTSEVEAYAYALARMPATTAVMNKIIGLISERIPFSPKSILDLGAGTGAGLLTFRDHFPEAQLFAVENDHHMLPLLHPLNVSLQRESILKASYPKVDCLIMSYVLGELGESQFATLTHKIINAAPETIIITTPGTLQDYHDLMLVRRQLIEHGYHILAPCPHNNDCPLLKNTDRIDWCHFSIRFERTKAHKLIKGGSLPYEDEKFSYLVATRTPIQERAPARIIKHPIQNKGHVILDFCTNEGIVRETIGKSDARYKRAHKADWGDDF